MKATATSLVAVIALWLISATSYALPPSEDCLYARAMKAEALQALIACKEYYPKPPWNNWKLNCSNESVSFHACVALTAEVCPHGELDPLSPAFEECISPLLCIAPGEC